MSSFHYKTCFNNRKNGIKIGIFEETKTQIRQYLTDFSAEFADFGNRNFKIGIFKSKSAKRQQNITEDIL